jgi:hypothetical protein
MQPGQLDDLDFRHAAGRERDTTAVRTHAEMLSWATLGSA